MSYTKEQLRKIDALIAEHMFGHEVFTNGLGIQLMYPEKLRAATNVPHYSTNIATAWDIVEKLHGHGVRIETGSDGVNRYRCLSYYNDTCISVRATTAPLAICLLALKSKGIDIEQELALDELVTEGQERGDYDFDSEAQKILDECHEKEID
jgi:hypothetical protein